MLKALVLLAFNTLSGASGGKGHVIQSTNKIHKEISSTGAAAVKEISLMDNGSSTKGHDNQNVDNAPDKKRRKREEREARSHSFLKLIQVTGIPRADLQFTLLSLCASKTRVLKRLGSGASNAPFKDSELFIVNDHMKSKLVRIVVNSYQGRVTKKDTKVNQSRALQLMIAQYYHFCLIFYCENECSLYIYLEVCFLFYYRPPISLSNESAHSRWMRQSLDFSKQGARCHIRYALRV